MLIPEHQAKFCMIQKQRGVFDFRDFDSLLAYAEANNMVLRAHTLIWHSCEPAWLSNGNFSREEAIAIMREHIYTVVGRYKGRIPIWDVVNEGIDGTSYRNTPLYRMIGEDYIELAFQFAHEADPDALLFYNDYGAEGMNGKAQTIYKMVSDFVARDVPIHGVGLQMHLIVGDTAPGKWLVPDKLHENMQRIADLGLQVQVTEMDVRHDGAGDDEIFRKQAADYRRVLEVCLDIEACTAYISWGVSDKYTWIRGWDAGNPQAKPLLFSDDYEPKLAYFAITDLLARRAGLEPILSDEEVDVILGQP
jgi:GH35 family endo-1,4-beta-xylanase